MKTNSFLIFLLFISFQNCQSQTVREKYWEDTVFKYFSRIINKDELKNRFSIEIKNDDTNKFVLLTISDKEILRKTNEYYKFIDFAIYYYIKKTGYEEKYSGSIILNQFRYRNNPLRGSIDFLIVFSRIDSNELLNKIAENKSNILRKDLAPKIFNKDFFSDYTFIKECLDKEEIKNIERNKNHTEEMQNFYLYETQTSCIQNKIHIPTIF